MMETKTLVETLFFLIMWNKAPRWLHFPPECGSFAHFLTTRLEGGKHPNDGSIFSSRKPILFDNIIFHLLHPCSILNKSCDTVT